MKSKTFDRCISQQLVSQVSQSTLTMWRVIHDYVSLHQQTDAFDHSLQKTLSEALGRWISDATLRRHFKRMSDAGLIEGHRIIVRYSGVGKAWLGAGFPYRGDGPPPGSFLRYTLPGSKPSLEQSAPPGDSLA